MDNKQIALSDVERYKELFEYEMTDVILQLKGEFAKISGKDLTLDYAKMSAPSINLDVDIPSVKLEPIALEIQEINGINCESTIIPNIAIDKTNVSCPTVAAMNIKELENVQIDKSSLDCPAVNINTSIELKDVSIKKTTIKPINTNITIPHVCEDSKVDIKNMALSEIDGVSVSVSVNVPNMNINSMAIKDVFVEKIALSPVNTDIIIPQIHEDIKVDIKNMALSEINNISILASVNIPNLYISAVPIDIPNTNIKIDSNIDLKFTNIEVDIPVINTIPIYKQTNISTMMPTIDPVNTDILTKVQIGSIAIEKIQSDVPEIKRLTMYKGAALELNEIKVDVPKINALSINVPDDVILDKISLNEIDIEAPILNINLAVPSNVSVRKSSMNIEYPTVSIADIPDVDIKKLTNVETPLLHDFSNEIQEIIDTVV